MSQPYVGEIRMFGGNFAPTGWMMCNGQILAISSYQTLFNLIGTTYGGDGQNTFALPDLRSRVPIHEGQNGLGFNTVIGQNGGTETVTLTASQMPQHSHQLEAAASPADQTSPVNTVLAQQASGSLYTDSAPDMPLHPSALGQSGSGVPHNNIQPVLAVNFIISMFGIFPSQT